jgi:hypothetical protein
MVTPNGEVETDLRRWGVFWTTNNPPTAEELANANRSLDVTCDAFIRMADSLYEQRKMEQITPIFHTLARRRRQTRPWCSVSKEMADCPVCFAPVEKGAAIHDCSPGRQAILDWEKAYRYGLVTRERYDEAIENGWVPGKEPSGR